MATGQKGRMIHTRMNPSPGREILIQTYSGDDSIPNCIDPDPDPQLVEYNKREIKKKGIIGIKQLGPPTGRYNCHGLVFASRRTCIPPSHLPDSVNIDDLLREDLYERVNSQPQVGDVVVYRANSEIDHTGYVACVEDLRGLTTVWVWSKWGALEECVHPVNTSPYEDCTIEYWRLV